MSHVAVIGAGAWGTALALLLAGQGENVVLWTWQPEHARAIERDRENREFFAGFPLPDAIRASSELPDALAEADLVLLVVPSDAFRETLERAKPQLPAGVPLVSATKGIENDSLMLMSEVIEDVLGSDARARSLFLSGPSFAKEVALGMPTNVVVAGDDQELGVEVQKRFATDRFRVYSSDDPVGVEMGGALKNVIAIAAGACDGLGFGHNTRAALITRGLAEISRLAIAKGGNPLTLAGLAGTHGHRTAGPQLAARREDPTDGPRRDQRHRHPHPLRRAHVHALAQRGRRRALRRALRSVRGGRRHRLSATAPSRGRQRRLLRAR